MSTPSNEVEKLAIEFWDNMFGMAALAKGGIHTITYKDFIKLFADTLATKEKEARIDEAYRARLLIATADPNKTLATVLMAQDHRINQLSKGD